MSAEPAPPPASRHGPAPHRVFVFPYLGQRARVRVGPFELVPWAQLEQIEVAEDWLRPRLAGFEEMHDAPVVFARHADEPLGVAPADELLAPLRRAVFVATIAGLPALDGGEGGGWYAASSDNTVAFVHPIPADTSIAIEIGRIVRTTRHGDVEGRRGGVPKPAELPEPLAPPDVDENIAAALYQALVGGEEAARRLAVAIDWLDIVWRNTDSITDEVRILAIHAGIEVLLMEGGRSNYRKLSRRYDEWLGSEVTAPRTWTINGEPLTEEFSDAAWWLVHFTWLRNAIAHGDARTEADYFYDDGRLHLVLGEHALRRLILIGTTRLTGIEDLLEDRFIRQIGRATGEWLRARAEEGQRLQHDDEVPLP